MLSDVDEIPAIELGDLTLRFELEDLNDECREVAERELRETPERKACAIEELRALLKGESKLFSDSLSSTVSLLLDGGSRAVRYDSPTSYAIPSRRYPLTFDSVISRIIVVIVCGRKLTVLSDH